VNKDKDSWISSRKSKRGTSSAWGLQDRGSNWRRWTARVVVVIGFVAFVAVAAYVVNRGVDWYQGRAATTTTVQQASNTTKTITIASGMAAGEVGRLLEEGGIIKSSAEFVDLVKSRARRTRYCLASTSSAGGSL
jgi:hypothetical protein